jgi:hypothetical protein
MRATIATGRGIPAALLLALVASGCMTVGDQMSSWHGHHVHDLIENWGVPDEIGQLGAGERAMTWVSASGLYVLHFTCRKTFMVSPDDSVERWSYRGCPPLTVHLSQQRKPPRRPAVGAAP